MRHQNNKNMVPLVVSGYFAIDDEKPSIPGIDQLPATVQDLILAYTEDEGNTYKYTSSITLRTFIVITIMMKCQRYFHGLATLKIHGVLK